MMAHPLRIFVSSPGDVIQERVLTENVLTRLQGEFAGYVDLQPFFWEHQPLRATSHFAEQIIMPADTDIVVCILWTRLGTRLPGRFKKEDGADYLSGTEWEFENAAKAYQEKGTPELWVYLKTKKLELQLFDEKEQREREEQKLLLDAFIKRWFDPPRDGFETALHTFNFSEEFEELLEVHLRKLIQKRLPKRIGEDPAALIRVNWFKGTPYRGLQTFDFEHAPVFFGRTKAIREVKDALVRQAAAGRAFLVVFGASGCGKSSLVRAGVLPTITHPGVIEGIGLWRRAVFRPGDAAADLFGGLALALFDEQALPELTAGDFNAAGLAALLRENPLHAVDHISAALKSAAEKASSREGLKRLLEARLALVVDQMEELFTLEQVAAGEREGFIAAISALARSGAVWVIATMRSDFYPHCAEIPELVALKEGNGQYDLLPPSFAEIGQMIRYPTSVAGLRFEQDPESGERLEDVLHEAAARDPAALPLLEFTLDELFERRREGDNTLTFSAYRDLGGLEGALARRAEEVYASLAPRVQAALLPVMRALATVGQDDQDKMISKRIPLDRLETSKDKKDLIGAFTGARLLVTDRGGDGRPVVGVAHDALLRHWPRLARGLEENRQFLRVRTRVADAASRWRQEDRHPDLLLAEGKPLQEAMEILERQRADLDDEVMEYINASVKKAAGRRRKKSFLIALTFMVFLGFGLNSFYLRAKAENQAAVASVAEERAVGQSEFAGKESMRAKEQSDIALMEGRNAKDQEEAALSSQREAEEKTRLAEQAREDAERDREEADNQRAIAVDQGKIAEKQRKFAEAQKVAAKKQKDRAMNVINRLTYDIPDSLENVPGTNPVLTEIFSDNIGFLEQIMELDVGSPEVRREWSSNLNHIGNKWELLGEIQRARAAHEKALEIYIELAGEKYNAGAQLDLALEYNNMGRIMNYYNNTQDALNYYQKSIEISSELAGDKKNIDAQIQMANAYLNIGYIKLILDETRGALEYSNKGLDVYSELAGDKENIQAQLNLASAYDIIGGVRWVQGDIQGALEENRKGFEICRQMADKDRNNKYAYSMLGLFYKKSGDIQFLLENYKAAQEAYENSLKIAMELAEDKTNILLQYDLAAVYHSIGYLQWFLGDNLEARNNFEKALGILSEIYKKKEVFSRQSYLALCYVKMAVVSLALGDEQGAQRAYDNIILIINDLARDMDKPGVKKQLASVYGSLAHVELYKKQPEKAIEAALKGLELDPDQVWIKTNLAHGYLYNNQYEKAKAIYIENQDRYINFNFNYKPQFKKIVLCHFKELKDRGLVHPDMAGIEQLLTGTPEKGVNP